jgi:D-alanyl-D-alanine carboxypeptidase
MGIAIRRALIVPFLLASGDAGAQTTSRADRDLTAFVDSMAAAMLAAGEAAGFSVAVMRGSQVVLDKGYGRADLEHDVAAGPETVYRIASVTKQFTAAAIVKLAAEGRLSLDDPFTRYVPDWIAPAQAATVRMLLNHTSGVRDYTSVRGWARTRALALPHDSLLAMVRNEPFDFEPGTAWRYNNTGYYLLAMIIERVSGTSYGEYIAEHFAKPLGLSTLQYCDARPLIRHRARGYARTESGLVNAAHIDIGQPFGAGALCSTAGDLARWARALADGHVVGRTGWEAMTTAIALPDDQPMNYGYGLGLGDLSGHRFVWHNGSIDGFHAQLVIYPDDALIVAVLANTSGGLPERIERAIARRVLEIADAVVLDLPIPRAVRNRVVGTYGIDGVEVRVQPEGEGLLILLPDQPPSRLLYQGEGRFVIDARRDVTATFDDAPAPARRLVLALPGASMVLPRTGSR